MEIIFSILVIVLLFWMAYNSEKQVQSINASDFKIEQINQTLVRIESELEKIAKKKNK